MLCVLDFIIKIFFIFLFFRKSVDNSGNPVLRSASFHGRDVFSQEDDSDGWEQKSLHFFQPVDDWHKLPQPPAVRIT